MDAYLSDLKSKISEYKKNLLDSFEHLGKIRCDSRKYIDLYQTGYKTLQGCKEEHNKFCINLKLTEIHEKLKEIKQEMDGAKRKVEYSELIFNSSVSELESLELLMSLPDID